MFGALSWSTAETSRWETPACRATSRCVARGDDMRRGSDAERRDAAREPGDAPRRAMILRSINGAIISQSAPNVNRERPPGLRRGGGCDILLAGRFQSCLLRAT